VGKTSPRRNGTKKNIACRFEADRGGGGVYGDKTRGAGEGKTPGKVMPILGEKKKKKTKFRGSLRQVMNLIRHRRTGARGVDGLFE